MNKKSMFFLYRPLFSYAITFNIYSKEFSPHLDTYRGEETLAILSQAWVEINETEVWSSRYISKKENLSWKGKFEIVCR